MYSDGSTRQQLAKTQPTSTPTTEITISQTVTDKDATSTRVVGSKLKECNCTTACKDLENDKLKTQVDTNRSLKIPSKNHATSMFDFQVQYKNPRDAMAPPDEMRFVSSNCPPEKPLCETRVALLMTGHIRGSLEGNRMASVKSFLQKCREETKVCDLFIHTWKHESFVTKTWNTANPTLGGQTDSSRLCRELDCTGIVVDKQELQNLNTERDWGGGGVSYEGAMMVPYALYFANTHRKIHCARFGTAHDVVVRIRPDYWRTAHGDVMPPQNFRRCISNIQPDTLYGVGKFIPGGAFPRRLGSNGQIRRPWEGNSGDNFFFARADVFDRFIEYWIHNFPDIQKDTLKWNSLNPEADLGTVLERLHIKSTTCT
eukprot:CAMPEP_0184488242 /NCGR_PEP_ID=MMETSP0113_2-20130426/10614_1 /TAXON_ID=91329 /ORGANISM="Norrisiella sphaerica, Strain BC52" /LENGTH=371 /DNA_ID=CAMNT_0026870755 /DNA_START=354 /DNA_END=1469 /DNA_ORIENTATION=+